MEAQACALLHLKLDPDDMLAAANLLEEHHLEFQSIEGRKTDPGEWNISVVAEDEYIGVSAFGPWGWSLFSVNDHIYVNEGALWSSVQEQDKAGKIFIATVHKVCELLQVPAAVFLAEDTRDRLESWAAGRGEVDFEGRRQWLRTQEVGDYFEYHNGTDSK